MSDDKGKAALGEGEQKALRSLIQEMEADAGAKLGLEDRLKARFGVAPITVMRLALGLPSTYPTRLAVERGLAQAGKVQGS